MGVGIGPRAALFLTRALLPRLRPGAKVALVSSRMGSIDERTAARPVHSRKVVQVMVEVTRRDCGAPRSPRPAATRQSRDNQAPRYPRLTMSPSAEQMAPPLQINADFKQRAAMRPSDARWQPSPLPGVQRWMLDRVGGEVARATSLVRYAPGSRFDRHAHGGGEEILVLDGVFSDDSGDHPGGTYLRNPPGSAHEPQSREGCLLFVKLRQFAVDDLQPVRIATRAEPWRQGLAPGLSVMPLHEHDGISTALVRWAPNIHFHAHSHPGGEEILVLDGVFRDEFGAYPTGSWLRSPRWSRHAPFTGPEGALIYVKVGHLGASLMGG